MRLVSHLRVALRRRRKFPPATSAARGFVAIREGHDPVPYQSDLERRFLVVCGCLPWVKQVQWEPFTLHFCEVATDLQRSYTPDFLVQFQDGNGGSGQVLVEVKRTKDRIRTAGYMAACYSAAEQWCQEQHATLFFHASDDWFSAINFPNFEFMFAARKGAVPSSTRRELVKALLNESRLTMEAATELLKAQGLSDYNQAAATLMALVSDGYLGFDVSAPLTMESRIDGRPIDNPFLAATDRSRTGKGQI
jgi:hypothetical protein